MTNVWSKEQRSRVMSRIRSTANKGTELTLVTIFRDAGIRGWRRRQSLIGKPDFIFRKQRVAVFVDGCFWHGCPRCYIRPASNQEYWDSKIERNRKRDKLVNRHMRGRGWRVIRIWEHDLRKTGRVVKRIGDALRLVNRSPKKR